MIYDVVYVCDSTNHKNIRGNELNILRKVENELYFEFGESENNIKKRYYKDMETLDKEFEEITKIKEKLEKQKAEFEKNVSYIEEGAGVPLKEENEIKDEMPKREITRERKYRRRNMY